MHLCMGGSPVFLLENRSGGGGGGGGAAESQSPPPPKRNPGSVAGQIFAGEKYGHNRQVSGAVARMLVTLINFPSPYWSHDN